jgi:5-(carboxyamino)imidazole ribonucleotide synthase
MTLLSPKFTLGILGGGQLGRMSALAAAQLGIRTHIFCPEEDCPASLVTPHFTCADYTNFEALEGFANSVDLITYEFENIPLETIDFLKKYKPVYPDQNLLEVSQNRLKEKAFLNSLGIETASWLPVHNSVDIDLFLKQSKTSSCIIKTARFGYDGKGQLKHKLTDDSSESWKKLNTTEGIAEEIIDFDFEASVIIARDCYGTSAIYPVMRNEHKNHILSRTIVPAGIAPALEQKAKDMAIKIADAVNLRGVLALELFVAGDRLIANEIAPRTHNSGHWTMDGASVSQFEQHVRAVCGWPVLQPATLCPTEMLNLIGDDIQMIHEYNTNPLACIHLYGKTETRNGRKMGHINILKPNSKP